MDPFEQIWGPPKTSGAGPLTIQLLKQLEGFAPVAKWDVRQHSGGYGSRAQPGERFTPESAEQRLNQEVAPVNSWLDKNITQQLSPERRAAFNSFGYNLGVDDLERLKPDINRGDWPTVGNRMLTFNSAGGEVNQGLINRRQKEAAMVTGGALPETQMPMPRQSGGPLANAMSGTSNSFVPGIMGGGDEPGYFGKLLADPTFLMGASVLGSGLSGGDAGTALARGAQAASATSEMTEKRRRAQHWQRLIGGQSGGKALEGVPPDVLELMRGAGPEEGMKMLGQLAMRKLAPRQLTPVSPGSSLYDEQAGKEVFRAPATDRFPAGYQAAPSGAGMEFIPGGPADPALKVKEVQYSEGASKAANFANMMGQAEALVAPVKESPLGIGGQMREGYLPEGAANRMRSPEYQAYRQAAMQWVRAKLRKESGAAISNPEFEGEFQTFFPQPGDTPDVITQKTSAREAALLGMKAESRGAYGQLFEGAQRQPGPPPGMQPPPPQGPQVQPPPSGVITPQSGPQPGAVEEGYRFRGGNPADPNSWERIQ